MFCRVWCRKTRNVGSGVLVIELREGCCVGDCDWRCLVCARCDSRPLLKAKEPRGRAESESRRSACREVVMFDVILLGCVLGLDDIPRFQCRLGQLR